MPLVAVRNNADRPHVAFEIGGDIGAQPDRRVELSIEDAGIATGEEALFEALGIPVKRVTSPRGQWQEVVHLGSPGEGLADRFQQSEVLRAAEDPAPGPRIVVDDALQVGEQIRGPVSVMGGDWAAALISRGARSRSIIVTRTLAEDSGYLKVRL